MKNSIRWPWFVAIPSLLVLLAALALHLSGYKPVYTLPFHILTTLAIAMLSVVGVFFLSTRSATGQSRRSIQINSIIVGTLVLLVGSIHSIKTWDYDRVLPVGLYHSPNSVRTLVVLEGDLIDHFYCAYPVDMGLFYSFNSLQFVAHGDQHSSDIQVRWLDDGSARVYIIYDPSVGPVKEDSILVSFH